MTSVTVIGAFLASAEKYRDAVAFNYFDQTWKSLTYGEFLRYTQGIASSLMQSGIKSGDRLAVVSENRFEWCASYLGILMAGGIAVPLDAQLGPVEIENLLADSGAVCVFHSGKTEAHARGTAKMINFDSPRFRDIWEAPEGQTFPLIRDGDTASIVYTSGTTGKPKGVMLTHRNFCSDAEAVISAGIVTPADNVLSILPLHHTYPFLCTFLVPLFLGAMITYPAGIKGPELISAMKERAVTILVAVPQLLELIRNGIMRRFSDMPSVVSFVLHLLLTVSGRVRRISGINIGKVLLRSAHKAFGEGFRFFASGGARLDPTVMEDLEAIGFTVLEGYGLTETSPVVTFNPIKKRKPGSVGKPLPSVEIKVADPSAAGEGEIAIRGPMVMQGYYRNPEETDKVIRDGWFLSGDLGYRDYEGYLFLTGRAKEVIVLSSGKNVYPEDLEREYLKIPLIKEICVTGIEERGVTQSLHGIIVPNLDHARKEKIGNVRDALRWDINRLSLTLPSYMRLKGFTVYADPLPRTRLGKLQRYMIKDLISLARGERREPREEDKVLLTDEAGRAVAECITPLLRESLPLHVTDNLELDLGLDSLQRIELVVAMEKSLSLRLPETFASDIQTVGELIAKVKEFRSRAALETEKPVMEDLSGEPSEEDIKRIGLRQGLIEWAITAVLLRVIRGILSVFFRLEVRGIENLPEPPFIIASNHCSNMDGFVIGSAVPLKLFRIMSFQGFQTYFSGWWLPSLFGRLAHAIPIDPETFLSKALRLSSYVLRKNRILCIFPEGGRSFDGTVMRFKKGIGILALQQNVPAVPALIEGTSEALPPGALWPKSKAITLSFGKPLYPKELNSLQKPEDIDEYQFFADAIRERVRMLRGDNLGT